MSPHRRRKIQFSPFQYVVKMSRKDDEFAENDESDGNAGFLRAARDGNLDEVLEYLKGSTDINTSNPNGLNALHLASKEGHIRIVSELITRGANVEAATKKGNTALHIASLAGHEDIVKILVESGAQVNLQAQAGFTPLYMASQEGKVEVVRFLLCSGANMGLSTEDGFTPLAVALQQGHDKVVVVLLEHDAKGKVRLPALHIAAKKDDVKSAALLLQNEQNNVELQTKSGFTPLHIAAHYGNINVANLLIQRNADVDFKAKNTITPLHVGSRWGKLTMVNLLLDNNATIDEKTRDGLTPLHCAARSGHDSVVDVLLERGAPHSAKTKNGLTPMHMAAQGDHEDCARLLLYHKASLNEVTVDYLTPLHVAAHCGNVKTAKLLLDRKCEPNARALNGFTPLHIACKKNRIKVVELLLKYGASIESKTESGLTPLHVASFMGHMNIVIYLIQHNANPNTATVRGETSLHLAARANQSDIIRILLRNGASVDAKAREQQTPLHIAARLGNVDNVVLLLQHGAAVDATTKDKYTPLHIAAKEGHEEVAQVLLENEAQHNITTKKGFTPLHIAAKYGNIKVARLLLQKDADPDVQGKNGLTPLHVAAHYNHQNVAQLLLENKADPHATAKNGYTPLHIAAKKNQMDIATMLLEYGAKPNSESKNGFTPLHLAAQEGHTDIVSLLLQKNANVNDVAHNGLTPMHLAAQEDKVPVAEILMKHDSETDSRTKAGYTPLHTACHFGQINMVRFLLDYNASVNATTKVGYTPLHQAAQQGHVQVVSLLLKHQASPNAVTNNGQSPLAIAQKLGYISVVEILKPVTEVQATAPSTEDKYKVVSPETMQEAFISDSEDEGGSMSLSASPYERHYLSDDWSTSSWRRRKGRDDKRSSFVSRDDSISLERGGSASPLDTSFDKDSQTRYARQDDRGRVLSQIGDTMCYPSYLENGPDYEAEMRYYHGDTLSPKDKNESGDKTRLDSVFGDYSTLGHDSLNFESSKDHSTANSNADIFEDDDLKYVADDAFLKKDYMDAQITSQSFSAMYSSPPPSSRLPVGTEGNRFSSYSGSSFSTSFDPDNVPVDRSPVYSGKLNWKSFLISFMVDARGGAMRGCRYPGVRIIIPPRKCSMPTRVTCRLVKKEKLSRPPPMIEGEGLAARVLEMGPVGTKFLGPVLIEVPHFASLRGKEREVIILRSDNGESWYEHPMQASEDAVSDALGSSAGELDPEEELSTKRIKRILTSDLPMYFALVSRVTRVKQESTVIGNEGGVLSSNVVPQVQAVFPAGTLTRPIPVGLQAQPIAPELVAKLLGNRVAVSPIVTVEPRSRKFHKPITLFIPVPRAAQKGMINQYSSERPTLRLLFSLTVDPNPVVWKDVTDEKPMSLVDDCVSFTTAITARFWLIDCQNVSEAAHMASVLYQEAVTVPYMAKFVVFAKRDSPEEGKLRVFCMTDDKDDKTLEKQEKFVEVARSRDIEVLEGRSQFVEMAGNLIPVTKSGDQLHVNFRAFRENRLPCTVKIRDQDQEPSARVAFMKEPKVARGEAPQTPICNLNIKLPDMVTSDSGDLDADKAELLKDKDFFLTHGIVLEDRVDRAEMKLSDIADTVQGDWVVLAQQLQVSMSDINQIKNSYKTVGEQAMAMLHMWVQRNGDTATGNELETALHRINRDDVVRKCMRNVERVDDEVEAAAARAVMDQSGFDTFKEEVGITKDSMRRGMSLDVQYDEQDMLKESESAGESPTSDKGHPPGVAPHAREEVSTSRPDSLSDEGLFEAVIDSRRPVVRPEPKTPEDEDEEYKRKNEAYLELAMQLDEAAEREEADIRAQKGDSDQDGDSVYEDNIVRSTKTSPVESFPALRPEFSAKPHEQRVTFSDQREEAEDEGEIATPPPSPTDIYQTVEPVQTTETDIREAASRLASEAAEDFDSEGQRSRDSTTMKEEVTKVMYSRAEVPDLASAPVRVVDPEVKQTGSEPPSQIVSPMSDASAAYHEEPASVPEPTLPDDFKVDELAFDKSETYDESLSESRPEAFYPDGDGFKSVERDGSFEDHLHERVLDVSSDADAYRTADQSLDTSGMRLDETDEITVTPFNVAPFNVAPAAVDSSVKVHISYAHEYDGEVVEEEEPANITLDYGIEAEQSEGRAIGEDSADYEIETDGRGDITTDLDEQTIVLKDEDITIQQPIEDIEDIPSKEEEHEYEQLPKKEEGKENEEKDSLSVDDVAISVSVDRVEHTMEKAPLDALDAPRVANVTEEAPLEEDSESGENRLGVDLTAVVGDEECVDHREETVVMETATLPREETPDRSFGLVLPPHQQTASHDRVEDEQQSPSVFQDNIASGHSVNEELLGDGTWRQSLYKDGGMELVREEGPVKEETEVEDQEQVLEDGTVHHIHIVRRHSIKNILKKMKSIDGGELVLGEEKEEVPRSMREDIVETFKEPAKVVHEEQDIEEVLDDGRKVHKHIVMNRMVHHIRTHQESFDSDHGHQQTDYEFTEIIPGTESAFVAGVDSSSSSSSSEGEGDEMNGVEEGVSQHRQADLEVIQELKDDGSSVTNRLLTAEETRTVRSRSGSVDESELQVTITEEEISPSPRPRSPTDPYDVQGRETVKSTHTTAHLEEARQDNTVECTLEVIEDMLATDALTPAESQPAVPSSHPLGAESQEPGDDLANTAAPGEEDELQSHTLMMKKEVHKKTTIGVDGQEKTTIHEDSQVQKDNDPPEELRDSMQEIIDQFMESNPEPAQLPEMESLEEEV